MILRTAVCKTRRRAGSCSDVVGRAAHHVDKCAEQKSGGWDCPSEHLHSSGVEAGPTVSAQRRNVTGSAMTVRQSASAVVVVIVVDVVVVLGIVVEEAFDDSPHGDNMDSSTAK